jgi:sugar phosphate permease
VASSTVNPTRQSMLRWQLLMLTLMVVGYAGCYLCRSNYSVSVNAIADSLVEQGYDASGARIVVGRMASISVLAYALGKFFTGSLADFLGGRRNILVGMFGSVLFTLLFAVSGTVPLFSMALIGNRLVQSLCWVGIVKVTGKWFSYSGYGLAMGIISLSYLFGDAAARWFMGQLLAAGLGWREVFWVSALGLLACAIANALWLKESPLNIGLDEPAANPLNLFGDDGQRPSEQRQRLGDLLLPLLTSPRFLVVCLLSLGLTLLRETFNLWSPAYFSDVLGSSGAEAAHQSALFPLLGGASVLLAGWLGDRLGASGRAAVMLAGLLGTAGVLMLLGSADIANSPFSPIWLVGLVGFLMIGPYSYLAGAISLDLGGKRAGATACGIIDGVGYLGAMVAGGKVARWSVDFGWPGTFQALSGVALLTSVAAGIFLILERK